jgi:AAA+ ATPase superfamily predicted ATPase
MIVSNPFTPKSGWAPKIFIGRENEIELFKKKLDDAKNGRCDHFLILGEWGVGKTSLLKEFRQIAQSKKILSSSIAVREFAEGDDFSLATEHLITQIPRSLPIRHEKLKKIKESLAGWGITVPLIGGGLQVPEKVGLKGDPQVVLIDALEKIWGELKEETEAIVVFLDDVQNYKNVSGYMTILKNALSDDSIANGTKFLFVLSSTYNGWSQFLVKHHPIGRYFLPYIKLKNLSEIETSDFLSKMLNGTGVEFDENVRNKAYEYTEGHPFELQLLCSALYDNQIGGKVAKENWDASLDATLTQMGEILLDHLYGEASTQEWELLKSLSELDGEFEVKNILNKVKGISASTARKSLIRLDEKGLLVKRMRGLYSFPDRMFREYVHRNEQA